MRILTVDVGTGTQDILLFDADQQLENCVKMVMPSPTLAIADQIRRVTAERRRLVLRGVTMGGGPCHWATNDHLKAGLPVYATPDAARTFDDDLDAVVASGIQVIGDDEAAAVAGAVVVELRDLWLDEIFAALRHFGVDARLDAIAVAAFDHGAAPPGYSDRVFRFDYLAERIRLKNSLTSFAYLREEIPPALTRLAAVAAQGPIDLPLLAMDTAPAAILGALEDERVWSQSRSIVANVGNFHCLAFRIEGDRLGGIFEHHSGELTAATLGRYVEKLAAGTLTNDEVYHDMGHGALLIEPPADPAVPFLAVSGPRRGLLVESGLRPYLAVPHGDMMLAGCFGLLRAFAARRADVAEAVDRRLGPARRAVMT
jgi:uncharacterized protein (DUF1786 family)